MMMRRSGGMGGGEVMRTWRTVGGLNRSPTRAGGRGRTGRVVGAFSSSSSSSQTSPPSPPPYSAASGYMAGLRSYPCSADEDWNMVENLEKQGNDGASQSYENYVFGRAPSILEFKEAISTFNDIFPFNISQVTEDGRQSWYEDSLDRDSSDDDSTDKVSSVDKDSVDNDSIKQGPTATSVSDWTEPTLEINTNNCLDIERSQNSLDIQGHLGVIHFLRQLEQNSSLEKIVSSIGTDNGVWQAVMNNEVVKELRKSFYEGGAIKPKSSDECHDAHSGGGGVGGIVNTTKAKIVEMFERIRKLLGSLFHSHEADDSEAFRSALKLPMKIVVMLFIIVVVHRVQSS